MRAGYDLDMVNLTSSRVNQLNYTLNFGSMGHRNTRAKYVRWGFPVQRFSRSGI
jgi:hypothetical protein